MSGIEINALISNGASFEGTVVFKDRIRVDGSLKGRCAGSGTLVVGRNGVVEGEISVATLIALTGATIKGEVRATALIELHPGTVVRADLEAPSIDIQKGCDFDGRCTIHKSGSNPPAG